MQARDSDGDGIADEDDLGKHDNCLYCIYHDVDDLCKHDNCLYCIDHGYRWSR